MAVRVPGLKRIRESRLLTQRELAEKAGISQVTVARIETGPGRAQLSTVRKLAAALECEPIELVGERTAP
jgi:XRE family transcriptional regulator, aerobic/anaerobic benzoate catabolism transcriptional regulator